MQKTIFLAALLLIANSLFGQNTFHKKIQNSGNFYNTTPLNNGEILCSGTQSIHYGYNQGLLVRFSPEGNILWRRRFPGLTFIWNALKTENGFVILGDTLKSVGSLPFQYNSVVSKLSSNGTVVWSKIFVNALGQATIDNKVIDGSNSNLLSGNYISYSLPTQRKSIFIKVDDDGNTLWSKIYFANIPNHYNSFSGQILEGDTLYACGNIQLNGSFVRINNNTGEIIGLSSFGGIYHDAFSTIKPTQDGNFILAGYTRSTTGSEESRPWVVKVNREGQIIWSKTYNLPGTSLTCNMAEANNGGFVLSMAPDNSNSDYGILAKIDASGNLLWAYNYAGGQQSGLKEIQSTSDGGFIALGFSSVLKTDSLGRVSTGCCPAPITFQVENYSPPLQNPTLIAEDIGTLIPYGLQSVVDTSFKVQDLCQTAITSVVEQILVCQGDSIQINGNYYQAPYTIRDTVQSLNGGCDTIRVFNLVQIPQPFRVKTLSFCPGSSVVVNGIMYTQPGTISQILPATSGCDTLLVTFLEWKPFPKKYQTTTFCPGETVFIDGVGYQFPGVLPNPDTLQGALNDCDTLLYQELAYPSEPSFVSVQCPPNLVVSTAPGMPIAVNYLLPTATSNCSCPDLHPALVVGLPTGAEFPVGNTPICYTISDVCGGNNSCCFEVKVEEKEACDIKESACIQYELLSITADADQNKTYRIRITNNCTSPLSYAAFQIPSGVEALEPAQNSVYTSPSGKNYTVRNPNYSPFYSVRFKSNGTGILGGGSDNFEYTLPPQASVQFIKAATRLMSGAFYEVTLNTFDCVLQANKSIARSFPQSTPKRNPKVSPNPSSGELFMDLSEWDQENIQLLVKSIHGQELAAYELASGIGTQSIILPEDLPDGLYFLEMRSEDGKVEIAKVVLRR